jgi:dTDP-4-dehydrorhamnose reductase
MTDQRIVILGVNGMLGHKTFQTLSPRFTEVFGTCRALVTSARLRNVELLRHPRILQGVDAGNWEALQPLLADLRPGWIVNCVGVIKQREAAKAAIPGILINSLLPHRLAEASAAWGGKVIHFSTDCVFSGRKGMYTESDESDALDLYGRSKFLGEVAISNALTLRTSIIGRELSEFRSLLEWFLSKRGEKIQGYRKALYSGLTTNYLADLVGRIIETRPDLNGLYQVTSGPISKLDLLCLIRKTFSLEIEIDAIDGEFCDRTMDGSRFASETGFITPPWESLIAAVHNDPTPYQNWRLDANAGK